MLREIPDSEAGHNDFERWWFEYQRQEWEAEQPQEEGPGHGEND